MGRLLSGILGGASDAMFDLLRGRSVRSAIGAVARDEDSFISPMTRAERAARKYTTYCIVPLWVTAGVADYVCHRRGRIDRTTGLKESLIHALMLTEAGIPTLAGLFVEVNAGVLLLMAAGLAAHEVTALWDLKYAQGIRPPSFVEQHVHSLLEMMPFAALSMMIVLHMDQFLSIFGSGSEPAIFRIERKRPPLNRGYPTAVLAATGMLAAAYGEEIWRCWRAARHHLAYGRRPDEDWRLNPWLFRIGRSANRGQPLRDIHSLPEQTQAAAGLPQAQTL